MGDGQIGVRDAVQHYDLMDLDDIKRMSISDLAEDDSHLWLWLTEATFARRLRRDGGPGLDTTLADGVAKPRLMFVNYLHHATEYGLFGARGKAPVKFRAQPNWLFAPQQDHSHKPEEIYAIIKRVSPGPISNPSHAGGVPQRRGWLSSLR